MKHTIQNERISFTSDSFNVEPWELRFNDEDVNYFWRPADLKKLGTAVCFPLLGTVPDNKYTLDGKEYAMPMHGFAQDREFIVSEKTETRISYELTDDEETYRQYPRHFNFRLTYYVEGESLKTEYRVENRDTRELFFSVGGHPRYNCPIGEGTCFEDYRIEFEKSESITNIVKAYGPISEIEKCFSADGKQIKLDYCMFTKGCFCFSNYNSQELCLKNDKNGRGIRINLGGADHLQFWTQPGSPFLAIEPFFGSISSLPCKEIDGDWVHKPGSLHIQPGEVYVCTHSVRPLR
ncbi:LACX protein [Spirochaetia bacterium]|nr:LACX protein [Spirochaetia bacterium]